MPHSLDYFRFCPVCGSPHFDVNNVKSKRCADCGFVYYLNPSAATAAFIENEKGELLVARRAKEPARGTFDLPGGFVDMEESGAEAIIREIKEEVHLDAVKAELLFSLPNWYLYSGLHIPTLDLFFRCTVADFSPLQADDDVATVFFIQPEALNPADFGLASIRKAIMMYKDLLCNN